MMETYAIQEALKRAGIKNVEIINFFSEGQKELYSTFYKNNSIKNFIKNLLILPATKRINKNNRKYEEFKNKYFSLSEYFSEKDVIPEDKYDIVVAGSDQIWNTTIKDSSDRYFIDWTNKCKKIAYAPSFGSKSIQKYSSETEKYKKLISQFAALSIREKNGQKWIKELTGKDAELLIDPTLLFGAEKYNKILDNSNTPKGNYIFFYCPQFDVEICKLVKKISKKYKLPVVCWSSKSYMIKRIWRFGFRLPKYESPAVYLSMIKNANLVITTSFHGTIFSTIYRKKFYVIKNGGMFGDDDRVKTLIEQLGITDRLIPIDFNTQFDYLAPVDYKEYEQNLPKLQKKAEDYINKEIVKRYEATK